MLAEDFFHAASSQSCILITNVTIVKILTRDDSVISLKEQTELLFNFFDLTLSVHGDLSERFFNNHSNFKFSFNEMKIESEFLFSLPYEPAKAVMKARVDGNNLLFEGVTLSWKILLINENSWSIFRKPTKSGSQIRSSSSTQDLPNIVSQNLLEGHSELYKSILNNDKAAIILYLQNHLDIYKELIERINNSELLDYERINKLSAPAHVTASVITDNVGNDRFLHDKLKRKIVATREPRYVTYSDETLSLRPVDPQFTNVPKQMNLIGDPLLYEDIKLKSVGLTHEERIYVEGYDLYKKGLYLEAVTKFQQGQSSKDQRWVFMFYSLTADIYRYNLKRMPEAHFDYKNCLCYSSTGSYNYLRNLEGVAHTAWQINHGNEALDAYDEYIEYKPYETEIRYSRARLLFTGMLFDEAIEDCIELIKQGFNPDRLNDLIIKCLSHKLFEK